MVVLVLVLCLATDLLLLFLFGNWHLRNPSPVFRDGGSVLLRTRAVMHGIFCEVGGHCEGCEGLHLAVVAVVMWVR
jgi:hypothetical protein